MIGRVPVCRGRSPAWEVILYIGAHVSTSGGVEKAVERAVEIGAEAMQIFPSSPRMWRFKELPDQNVAKFKAAVIEANLGPTIFHGIYLVALGSSDPSLVERSVQSLISYLSTADKLGAAGVVFHPASHRGAGYDAVEKQMVDAIHRVLAASPGDAWLALENSAGMGDHIGSKFEELGRLIKAIDHPRIRVCLDTQHAWAAGYDVATPAGLDDALADLDQNVGLGLVAAIHANDSKTPLGSAVDRHENIGQGAIGIEGFTGILRNDLIQDIPLYLEVPGFDKAGPDKKNLDILKKIRSDLEKSA